LPRDPPQAPAAPEDEMPPFVLTKSIESRKGRVNKRMSSMLESEGSSVGEDDFDGIDGTCMSTLGTVKDLAAGFESVAQSSCATRQHRRERSMLAVESFVGFVIVLNTFLLGVSSDWRPEWIGWVFIDGAFGVVFLLEVLFKMYVFGASRYFCGPERFTNAFEFTLVVTAMLEFVLAIAARGADNDNQKLLSLFRVVRLFRVFRVLRVLRLEIFTELKLMIRGTLGGMRTLMWSCILIFLPVYSMSLVLRETIDPNEVLANAEDNILEYFNSVPRSFFTVFRCIVIGECSDTKGRPVMVLLTDTQGWAFGALYCVMAVFMSFGLFNVIVAMFVENVVQAAKAKEVQNRKERLRDKVFFAKKMSELLKIVVEYAQNDEAAAPSVENCDIDQSVASVRDVFEQAADLEISKLIFEQVREDSRARRILDELDIADEDAGNLFDTLDCDNSGSIDIEELCNGIAKLRGKTCRSDIVGINFLVQDTRAELRGYLTHFLKRMHAHEEFLEKAINIQRGEGQVATSSDRAVSKTTATKKSMVATASWSRSPSVA